MGVCKDTPADAADSGVAVIEDLLGAVAVADVHLQGSRRGWGGRGAGVPNTPSEHCNGTWNHALPHQWAMLNNSE
jgi:hypothetical protein